MLLKSSISIKLAEQAAYLESALIVEDNRAVVLTSISDQKSSEISIYDKQSKLLHRTSLKCEVYSLGTINRYELFYLLPS
jgi:hypothetical protein